MMKLLRRWTLGALLTLCLLLSGVRPALAQQAQYSNAVFPAVTVTATGQTSAAINLSTQPSGGGGSFSAGTITVSGVGLTTATFGVMGSSDGGQTFYALNINPITSPSTVATTETVTANGLYQVNLAGITAIKIVTSGTFTATSVTFTLTASPNGIIARAGGGGANVGYSNYGSINTFGDSITQGTGSQNFMAQGLNATGYAEDLIADYNGNGQDYGVGGDQAADLGIKVAAALNPTVSNNPITTMMISTNDVNVYGANTNLENVFQGSLMGAIAWASIPDVAKTATANQANCVRTGTWNNDGPKIYSNVSGSSLTCTITVAAGGGAIYLTEQMNNTYGGTANITIDGAAPSVNAAIAADAPGAANFTTANGSANAEYAYRYPVAAGTHTFVLTMTNSSILEPIWIGAPSPAAAGTVAPPIVFVGGTPWNNGNTPATTTAAYNSLIQSTVATLAGDGLNVYFVDIRNGVNTRNSAVATPLNSTTDYAGGQEGTVTCPVSTLLPYHPNSSTTWSRSCGHGHLAANFEAAIGIKAGGQTTSQVVKGALYTPGIYPNFSYALSLNGQLQPGYYAGISFGNGDPNLHLQAPVAGGGFHFDVTNGTGTITDLYNITSAGMGQGNGFLPGTLYSAAGTPVPTCAVATEGEQVTVRDATTPTYMGAYASGGAITTAVICSYNGTAYSWLTH